MIGDKIKKIRREAGLTQKELAEKCGLNRNSIYKYEKNETIPKIEQLKKIASVLGVSITDFVELKYVDPLEERPEAIEWATQWELDSMPYEIMNQAEEEAEELFLSKVKAIPDKQLEKEILQIFRLSTRAGKWKIYEFCLMLDEYGKYKDYDKWDRLAEEAEQKRHEE